MAADMEMRTEMKMKMPELLFQSLASLLSLASLS